LNELHGLPGKVVRVVMGKVRGLQENPLPDGRLKKKLAWPEGVHSLRVGDYRVLYQFDAGWVWVLSVRHRKDAYSGDVRLADHGPGEFPPDEGLEDRLGSYPAVTATSAASVRLTARPAAPRATASCPGDPNARLLERSITPGWLASLKIAREYHGILSACLDETSLLNAAVPDEVLSRVVDNLWPRDLDEVMQQPDYVVQQAEDLQRYKDGDLLGFLLRMDPDQEQLVVRRGRGPAIIKGGPGSGKSTVAIYRVKWILDQAEAEGRPVPRILFTTYTKALTRFSEQLLEQLLGARASSVTVSTADRIAWEIVERTGPMPELPNSKNLTDILLQVKTKMVQRCRWAGAPAHAAFLLRQRSEFLLFEFEWIIEGRNLKRLQEYLEADRTGRGLSLTADQRRLIWQLYQEFRMDLLSRGLSTFGLRRSRALELVQSGECAERYDAVIIDEAQDLTATTLALLTELCRDRSLLFLTADGGQSIYSRGFTWNQVHESLRFQGRTRLLKRNYRTSREIAEAAAAFLSQAGAGDFECLAQEHIHSGPRPVLHGYAGEDEQWAIVADFIRRSAFNLRLPHRAAAVLAPTNDLADSAAEALTRRDLPARHVRGADLDLKTPEVKVMTLHSAKGLEFPIVVVLIDGLLPRLHTGMVEEEKQACRRLLYVGFTRAMRALLVAYPLAKQSPFVSEIDGDDWQRRWMFADEVIRA
jgi:superfamily I DNA/RNA helicase/mRNA-degrading endonuclease RelE of RelBE toxin-antitoxin system